jgi:uncharacterized protein YcgI (DUF1989 family)
LFELLGEALAEFGVAPTFVTDRLNVFMNVRVEEGVISIAPSISRPGETLELRAEHDCIVGVSACPDDRSDCNNHNCTRIGIEVV